MQAKLHNGLFVMAIPHNSKCRYGERGTADAKPKAQIILDAAKVSAASGRNSEPKQGQRSQSARGFCPRSTMRVPQPGIIEHFGNADAVPQLPDRCLSRKAGIMRCCPKFLQRLQQFVGDDACIVPLDGPCCIACFQKNNLPHTPCIFPNVPAACRKSGGIFVFLSCFMATIPRRP